MFEARAMSYLEVYRISRNELLELARPFPVGMKQLRYAALRLALVRSVAAIQTANMFKKMSDGSFRDGKHAMDGALTQARPSLLISPCLPISPHSSPYL